MDIARRNLIKVLAGSALCATMGPLEAYAQTPKKKSRPSAQDTVTNIVINGALGLAFRPRDIYVFAPIIDPMYHPHNYQLDCYPWAGVNHALSGLQGNSAKRQPADYGISPSDAIIVDCNTYALDPNNKPYAAISIPYPDEIKRMRWLDMAFADQSGGAKLYSSVPGALVFEYANAPNNPMISNSAWKPDTAKYHWLVDINVIAKTDDPNLQHAKAAWKGLAKFFPTLPWQLHSASSAYPAASATTTGLKDADIEKKCTGGTGANCKHGVVLVTNPPASFG